MNISPTFVKKLSNRPFKSGLKINTVKSITINPYTNKQAYTFNEDDSIVDIHKCITWNDDLEFHYLYDFELGPQPIPIAILCHNPKLKLTAFQIINLDDRNIAKYVTKVLQKYNSGDFDLPLFYPDEEWSLYTPFKINDHLGNVYHFNFTVWLKDGMFMKFSELLQLAKDVLNEA